MASIRRKGTTKMPAKKCQRQTARYSRVLAAPPGRGSVL
jgi:hypothetical protein